MKFKKVETALGIIFSVFIVITISIIFPYYSLIEEMRAILTVATFLFGIFSGFVIASRLSRYSRYRELLTNETGYLITIHYYSRFVNDKFAARISDLIDNYLVQSFLYEVYEFHEKTEQSFHAIFNELKTFKPKKEEETMLNNIKAIMKDMLKDREELYLLGKDKIAFWLKTTLAILAGAIFYGLFLARTDTLYSFILTILLSTSVIIVLFLVRDLDKLKFYNEAISYGIYFRVFDAIGKPHLYTNETLKRGVKIPKGISYRFAEIERKKGSAQYKSVNLVTNNV